MNYRRVTDPAEIRAYLEGKREVAFDFETAPLAPWRADSRAALDSHRADIVGVSLSVEERTAIYIPLAHRDGQNADPLRVIPLLRDLVWENPEVVRIVHNLCFESAFLYAHGMREVEEPGMK
jgi:DNA polymerase-1